MADIDIEEHDLLENPAIKRIFPDLSILKKEIIDFTKESNDGTINSEEVDLNTLTASNTNSSCGNKKTLNGHIKKEKNIKNAIVILDNISPSLKRSKKFCQMCLILFPDKCSLDAHNNLLHYKTNIFKDNLNNDAVTNSDSNSTNKNINSSSVIRDINVMFDINIRKRTVANVSKSCVHCDVSFPNEKLLIDHLYDVLNAKKRLQDTERLKKPYTNAKNKHSKTNVMLKKKFHCCVICSYYFDSRIIYKQHLSEKHNLNKITTKIPNRTVQFWPICKFCNIRCSNKVSYNSHLHLSHKEEIYKKQNIEEYLSNVTSSVEKYSKSKVKDDIINSKKDQMETYNNSKVKNSRLKNNFINKFKTTLFKCMKCKIFFLTLKAALNHNEHSHIIINWKCSRCQRIFKKRDSKEHEEQHNLPDNDFMESVVFDKGYNDLCQCQKCTVYFKKEDIFNHQIVCDSKTSISSYCEICDILIEQDIYISHKNSHESDSITNSESNHSDDNIVKENVDTKRKKRTISRVLKKKEKGNYIRTFYFCNLCECNIPQGRMGDHLKLNCTKLIKCICEYCGLAFMNVSIIGHRSIHKKYTDVKLQDFAFYDFQTKQKLKPRQKLPKCITCEKHFIHHSEVINHLCKEGNNLVCSICNIKLSALAFKLHVPFHSYKLKSNVNHFPRSIKNRKDKNMGDHDQSVKTVTTKKKKNMDCNIENNTVVDCNIAESDQNMGTASHNGEITHSDEKVSGIYTCINCDVSMNAYDEAIGHCHKHSNLNNLHLASIECVTCNLKFVVASYDAHLDLHVSFSKDQFKQFTFDILYFSSDNDTWIKHLFGSLPTDSIDRFIRNSIYKDERRMKLEVTQQGLAHLTVHKCGKCKSFVDSHFIYKHMAGCRTNSEKFFCKFCNLPFVNTDFRKKHEVIHNNCTIDPKLYRIVTFNREEDKSLNIQIANIKKYYVLYQCRSCYVVVDKRIYKTHKCYSTSELKKCCKCGLLIHESEYNLHISNHNRRGSFNKDYMYVNMLGSDNKNNNVRSNVVSSFSGMISDYTFFKCAKCDICVRDRRSTVEHFCLIDAGKSECHKCGLIFDQGKLKGHLKLHETDPEFTKDTIMIKTFGEEEVKNNINSIIVNTLDNNNLSFKEAKSNEDVVSSISKLDTVKIFKCLCGLHFLNKTTIREHSKGCSGKIKMKQSKQNCLKCGLTFSNDILFQHLLEHHKGKHVSYEYDIIET
ncbi:unnamed protein product, partial [Brenthis ino]